LLKKFFFLTQALDNLREICVYSIATSKSYVENKMIRKATRFVANIKNEVQT
jgi:hypothetical protein